MDAVQNKYPRLGLSTNRRSLVPEEKLLLFLYFISGDIPSHHHRMSADISLGCLNESIHESVNVLFDHIVPRYIKLPNNPQGRAEARLFSLKSGWPVENIWAATDGTNIRVRIIFLQKTGLLCLTPP